MKNKGLPALAVTTAMLLAACAQNAPMKQQASAFEAGQPPPPQVVNVAPPLPTLVLIAPTGLRAEPVIPAGCWVKLFDEPDFQGRDGLTLAGPVSLPDIHRPDGKVYWPHHVRSILVGPHAKFTAFEARGLRNPLATLQPGTEQTRLDGALATAPVIASIRLDCV